MSKNKIRLKYLYSNYPEEIIVNSLLYTVPYFSAHLPPKFNTIYVVFLIIIF